jgi:hypothetical protein
LTDVLDTHWSAAVNEKTHPFWSHRQLLERIELTLGDGGITVQEVNEAESSSECPECGSTDVTRNGDSFRCHDCELDAHSDVAGAWNIVQSEEGPMPGPLPCLLNATGTHPMIQRGRTGSGTNTTGHRLILGNSRVHLTNPASANPQVDSRGNRTGWITHGGILAVRRGGGQSRTQSTPGGRTRRRGPGDDRYRTTAELLKLG